MIVFAEDQLDLTLINLLTEEAGGKHQTVANALVVDLKQVGILVAHGKRTCGTRRQHGFIAL